MLKLTLTLATCALLSVASHTYANPEEQSDYHFQATLGEGSASLRSVRLPWSVISNLLQENLQDLQVYNADQQVIPYTIHSVAANQRIQKQTKQLNFFPMGDIEKLGTILKHEANEQRYQAIKLIQTGQRYLIIDNPNHSGDKTPLPLQQLTLNWDELSHWMPKSLQVEVSDDLTQWQTVAIKKLPFYMAESNVTLENRDLHFTQPVLKRFIRLSGAEDFAPLLKALNGVSGHYHQTSVTQPINWNSVSLQKTKTAREYHYDLPPSLSVKQWHLESTTPDSLYKGKLYTRDGQRSGNKPAKWRFRQDFLQYSIQTDDGLITSDAGQNANLRWSHQWRIDLEQDFNTDTTPKLALAWEPLELVFIAQGKGPFQIRYASRSVHTNSRINLDQLLRETTPEAVSIKSIKQLSAVAEKKEEIQYKYLLWGLLAAAVLMLLYMAKSLLRDMES